MIKSLEVAQHTYFLSSQENFFEFEKSAESVFDSSLTTSRHE